MENKPITIHDIREWSKQIEAKDIPKRKFTTVEVEDLGNGFVRLTGGCYGVISKDVWVKALSDAAK